MKRLLLALLFPSLLHAQTVSYVSDFVLSGKSNKADALIDIYVDSQHIDRISSSGTKVISYQHAPFGRGTHTVKVVERNAGADTILLNRSFNSNCNNMPADDVPAKNWCLDMPHYWLNRQSETTLLQNPMLAIGIDNSLGGAIMQLYGKDRKRNLLTEHGGAAMQLSLWGIPHDENPATSPKGFSCQNVPALQAILNPIQASTKNCWYEDLFSTPTVDEEPLNDVSSKSFCGDKCWYISRQNPYQFTHSWIFSNLFWSQQVLLSSYYARVTYTVSYTGKTLDTHPQEIPGIQLTLGPNAKIYWKGFKAPYPPTPSLQVDTLVQGVRIPVSYLLRAYEPVTRVMSEPWFSACSTDELRCVTVVFPATTPDLKQFNFEYLSGSTVTYASPLGFFSLTAGLKLNIPLSITPMKYDKLPEGVLATLLQ